MSLGRSSAVIAAGTFASRITGLLRSMVLITAIGGAGLSADAFAIANQVPNYVFQVISTGVLTAVFVPQIVKWSQLEDGGKRMLSKLFTLGTLILLVVTVVATLAAPLLISAFSDFDTNEQYSLAVAFAYWCIPQVFFYGVFALVGETLNARRIFAPYAWAPIVNNLVSIAGFSTFIWLFGGGRRPIEEFDTTMIVLLGGTATLGIVAQSVTLLLFWRKTGLKLRADFVWRGMGLGQIQRIASWSIGMLLLGLLVAAVQQQVISTASTDEAVNASSNIWFNAWLVFMLPYSLIVMSIGTPYFTRLSEHAHAGRDTEVKRDISAAIKTLGLLVVFAAVTLAAAAVPAARLFSNDMAEASATAPVLVGFLVGLVPLAVLFIVQRSFYAYGDTRTPFFFTLFQAILTASGALLARSFFTAGDLTLGVALIQSFASTAQVLVAIWLLRRKLGPLHIGGALWAIIRFTFAAIPTGLVGISVYLLFGGPDSWMVQNKLFAAAGCAVIGSICALVYGGLLAAFRTPELTAIVTLIRGKLGR
ncbi:murein biosynthesis integral membrane protein MurJ [Microbacterium amylolyticum]|uniref:Peptidoglycan lipid II flippase n=1 Tax=Microbacterium amylolyticum TaxID=936337 RepID=A0ABS4ZHQ7_9MICO|nr:lipid II flippase MurJ [Microbacterium amylolyticum]MBP2436804.1 putative peptidoglycan lipid II flippase [Microbacterium amylolyticum]